MKIPSEMFLGEYLVRTDISDNRTSVSSPILVTLIMEAIHSSGTSVLIRPTTHHIPEDGVRHSHRR
jgi:hypothetical protein